MKDISEKRPTHGRRISYGKVCSDGMKQWRLYRRSEINRRVFCESRTFDEHDARRSIANELRRMRARLRDAVDAYDLSLLGETP